MDVLSRPNGQKGALTMTDNQYLECKAKGIQIYQIWFKNGKFHKKKCKYSEFDDSWIGRAWINKSVPYNSALNIDFMYASEDKLECCKEKLLKYLKKQQLDIIKEAKKKLKALEEIQ